MSEGAIKMKKSTGRPAALGNDKGKEKQPEKTGTGSKTNERLKRRTQSCGCHLPDSTVKTETTKPIDKNYYRPTRYYNKTRVEREREKEKEGKKAGSGTATRALKEAGDKKSRSQQKEAERGGGNEQPAAAAGKGKDDDDAREKEPDVDPAVKEVEELMRAEEERARRHAANHVETPEKAPARRPLRRRRKAKSTGRLDTVVSTMLVRGSKRPAMLPPAFDRI